MGRDLFVKNVVSVSLILNFENIKIINKLRQSQKFNCYVTDYIEHPLRYPKGLGLEQVQATYSGDRKELK